MGGSAFSVGPNPLFTPRMPKNIYLAVRDKYCALLQQHYVCVASPIEGPGKLSFGDVDILLCLPRSPVQISPQEHIDLIGSVVGAHRTIFQKGNGISANFALPWPEEEEQEGVEEDTRVTRDTSAGETKFIQSDIRLCETLESFHWMLFKHCHGDMWNILGSMIREYGLTVDDDALWVRVPEIQEHDKKRAKIRLTSEPAEVLNFLGLPIDPYWERPFDSNQDMYEYAAKCTMMYVPPAKTTAVPDNVAIQKWDPENLKANDRRRARLRPSYRYWVEDFIPQCRQRGRFSEQKTTHEQVTKLAVSRFNVENEFHTRRHEFLLEEQRAAIWRDIIKTMIPMPDTDVQAVRMYRSHLVRALEEVILEGSDVYGVEFDQAHKDDEGFYDLDAVRGFIIEHKDSIGEAASARQHAAYLEIKRKKEMLKQL